MLTAALLDDNSGEVRNSLSFQKGVKEMTDFTGLPSPTVQSAVRKLRDGKKLFVVDKVGKANVYNKEAK